MSVDTKGLALLIQEASALSKKARLDKQEERRNAWLLASISALKQGGVTLAELDEEYVNERAKAFGLPQVNLTKTANGNAEARAWQAMVNGNTREIFHEISQRDMTEGAPMLSQIGSYNTSGGTFVPTGFVPQLFAALAEHDGLFDPENVTRIDSTNGRPLAVPTASDVENVADLLSEASSQTSVDIYATNHVTLGAYSFSSPRFVVSIEAMQDLNVEGLGVIDLAKRFFADRIARGIGSYLINGTGSSQPTGLLQALFTQTPVTAQGSAANDGGTGTGANSLGSQDFSNALAALDDAYASSPKCAWAMNKKTLAAVSGQLDKYGNLVNLVKYDADGNATTRPCRASVQATCLWSSGTSATLRPASLPMRRSVSRCSRKALAWPSTEKFHSAPSSAPTATFCGPQETGPAIAPSSRFVTTAKPFTE